MDRLTSGFLPAIWFVGIVCALIAIEDLRTAVLIGVVSMAVLLTAGVRLWHAGLVVPFGLAVVILPARAPSHDASRS